MKRFKVFKATVALTDVDNYLDLLLNDPENKEYEISHLNVTEFEQFAPGFFVILILENKGFKSYEKHQANL